MFGDVMALAVAGLPLQILVTLSATAIYALLPNSEIEDERLSLKATASVVLSLSLILLLGVGLSLIHLWSMWSLLAATSIVLCVAAFKLGRFKSQINRIRLSCLSKLLPLTCFLLMVSAIIVFYEEYSVDDQMYGFLGEALSRQGDLFQPFSIRRLQGLPGKSFLDAFSFDPRLNTQIVDVSISGILLTSFGLDLVQRGQCSTLKVLTLTLPFSILYLASRIFGVEDSSHTYFLTVSLLIPVYAASMREVLERKRESDRRSSDTTSSPCLRTVHLSLLNPSLVGLSLGLMVVLRSNNATITVALSLPLLIIWRSGLVRIIGAALMLFLPFLLLQFLEVGNILYPFQKTNVNPYFFSEFVEKRGSANSLSALLKGAFRFLNEGSLLVLTLMIFAGMVMLWKGSSLKVWTAYHSLLLGSILASILSLKVAGEVYLSRYWIPPVFGFLIYSVVLVLTNLATAADRRRPLLAAAVCCIPLAALVLVGESSPRLAHTAVMARDAPIVADPRVDASLSELYAGVRTQLTADGSANVLAMADFPELLIDGGRRVNHVDGPLIVLPKLIDSETSTPELLAVLKAMEVDSFVSVNSKASFLYSTDRYRLRMSNPKDLWAQWFPWSSDLLRSIHDHCSTKNFSYGEISLSVANLTKCVENGAQ